MRKINRPKSGKIAGKLGFFASWAQYGAVVGLLGLCLGCNIQLIHPQQDPFYRAIESSQGSHEAALLGLGMEAYGAGQYKLAERYFADFVKLRPGHALGWYYLSSCRLEQREFKRAVVGFKRSLELEQRREAMVGLFYAQLYRGETTAAAAVLNDLKNWGGENDLTHRLEGELHFAQESYAESLSSLRRSLELRPSQPDVVKRIEILEFVLSE